MSASGEIATRPVESITPELFGLELRPVTYGIVELWPAECQALVDGRRVPLTRREFEILHAFVTCGGHVVSQSRVRGAVWGSTSFPEERDRSVDVYVGKLRRKLAKVAPDWSFIHTHFGLGYRFDPEPRDG